MGTKARPSKDRLDRLLVTRGLVKSRDAAVRHVLAGAVKINGVIADKPAKLIPVDSTIDLVQQGSRFVSRGGDKLVAAIDTFSIDPRGAVCLDVGCSTGGFTDCLLQKGAARVYAIDVGYGQFDWRLRQDPRVVLLERTNVRYIDKAAIPELADLVVVDVSFISLTLVLRPIVPFLRPGAAVITLVKPQFEVGKGQVGRGGVVREEALRQSVLQRIVTHAATLGLRAKGTLESPIKGKKGNQEILELFEFHPAIHDMKETDNCSTS